MKRVASFAAGFVTGWVARSTVDSSREAFVKLGSLSFAALDRVRRIFALERERMNDLMAEARARAAPESAPTAPMRGDGAGPEPAGGPHEHAA